MPGCLQPAQHELRLLGGGRGRRPSGRAWPSRRWRQQASTQRAADREAPAGAAGRGQPPVPDDDEFPAAGAGGPRERPARARPRSESSRCRRRTAADEDGEPVPQHGGLLVTLLGREPVDPVRAAGDERVEGRPRPRLRTIAAMRGVRVRRSRAPVAGRAAPAHLGQRARRAGPPRRESRFVHWRSGTASCTRRHGGVGRAAVRGTGREAPPAPADLADDRTAGGTARRSARATAPARGTATAGCTWVCARRSAAARGPRPRASWRTRGSPRPARRARPSRDPAALSRPRRSRCAPGCAGCWTCRRRATRPRSSAEEVDPGRVRHGCRPGAVCGAASAVDRAVKRGAAPPGL